MSSGGESSDVGKENGQPNKKRRIQRLQRACDVCRRKKIRCDWAVSQGNKCSYCRAHELDCNYTHGARETKQGISEAYVEDLESCIRKVTAYLNRFHPEVDLTREFGLPHDLDGWMKTRKKPTDATSTFSFKDRSLSSPNAPRPVKDEPLSSDEESFKLSHVQERMQDLHIVDRFLGQASVLGKSSSVTLIKSALDMKRGTHSNASLLTMGSRRGEHWGPKPWEIDTAQTFDPRLHDFPPSDLLYSLIELWFNTRHHLFPLLHKPTFMKHLADGLHYREGAFAGVVLTVCACASRFSSDPRVVYPGTDSWPSAGWQWFIRARTYHQVSLSSPTLHDVQMYCMGCAYLEGTSMPQACWTLCGTAIRLAQDVGAHRKKAYQAKPTVEDELWKRAFWCLVFTDRWLSAQLGRTCAIQDEEFDLDYPTDCDDEYWMPSDSSEAFTQPPGKPSSVSWFISMLKLNKILGLAMRTIFAMTNKNNLLLDLIGPNWEQRVVSAIDSALNQWVDSIPEHLKWKPDREEVLLMVQSADLYLSYYELQISIHRCFLPTPQKPSPVTFPSLAICTNAARSCCHVLECARAKLPKLWREHAFGMPAFNAALVLLLNIFGAKRNGIAIDTAKDMACVHICMQAIKDAEMRWPLAGRLWDILHNLSSVGDLSLPNEPSPPHSNTHTSSSPISALSQHHSPTIGQPPSMPTGSPHGPPVVAPMNPYLSADAAQPILFTNSNDLGRLPVHLMSKPLPASLEMTSQAYTTSYHGDAPDLFGVSSILDPSALTTLGGPLDMNIPWPAAVAGGPSPDAWSQNDLAQLLGSLGNVQQGLVGSGGTWENMPFGFRLDGWDSYLADLASETQNHETLTGNQANQGPRSSETNSGLVQSTDPLFNIL